MVKSGGQKGRLLALREILLRQTDEEHGLTLAQLQGELEGRGLAAERKSLYDDIETLRLYGLDVMREGRRYFVAERPFQLPELKLLVDAVQACKFITRRKSDQLIGKVEGLCSAHQARQLQRQVYVAGRVKTENEAVYFSVDALHGAISQGVQVSFAYEEWALAPGGRRFVRRARRDGQAYRVSPWALTWDDENYYLIAFDSRTEAIRHYRVDKMAHIRPLPEMPREGADAFANFDMGAYSKGVFGMFGGEEETLLLWFAPTLAGVVADRFGPETPLRPVGEGFAVRVKVRVSPPFWSWLFGLGAGARILEPPEAVNAYLRYARETLAPYGEGEREQ